MFGFLFLGLVLAMDLISTFNNSLKFTNLQNFLFYSILFLFLRARYVHQRNPYN